MSLKEVDLSKIPEFKYLICFVVISLLGAGFFFFAYKFPILNSLRAAFGFFYVTFLPGFVFVRLFFKKRELDEIEQIALSFGMSMALVILTVVFTNLVLNLRITAATNLLVIAGLMVFMIFISKYRERFREG